METVPLTELAMKKYLSLILALLVLTCSCNKEQSGGDSMAQTFSATTEGSSDTEESSDTDVKTGILPVDKKYNVVWKSGDRISVNGKPFQLALGEGTTSGTFVSTDGAEVQGPPFKARYPVPLWMNDATLNLPPNRTWFYNNVSDYPMYTESASSSLHFCNLCGLVKLVLSSSEHHPVRSITLSAVQGMSGTGTVSPVEGQPGKWKVSVGRGGSITIDCGEGGLDITSGMTFFVYVPENSYETFTVSVQTTDGYSCIRTSNKAISVSRSKYTTVKLTLKFNKYEKHEFVDLGLPSGTLWAKTNIGAENCWDYGDWFAWAATEPHYKSINPFVWKDGKGSGYVLANAPYYSGSSYTKYELGTSLETADDAATQLWGGKWHIPGRVELAELLDNCIWFRVAAYPGTVIPGVYGYKAKKEEDKGVWCPQGEGAPSGQTYNPGTDPNIFLPFAGFVNGVEGGFQSGRCYLFTRDIADSSWPPEPDEVSNDNACGFWCDNDNVSRSNMSRSSGRSLRPVFKP